MTTPLQILSFISFALGVVCFSIRELQVHGKLKWMNEPNGFWGELSHLRKYKTTEGHLMQPRNPNWYYRFFKIKYTEKFPLSATLLVSITDGAHLCQTLFKLFFCISIVTYSMEFSLWAALMYFVIWGFVFTSTYKWLSK